MPGLGSLPFESAEISVPEGSVLALPVDPSAVANVRKRVSERLAEWGLEEFAFTTELVVSELVTNAIRYGGSSIRLQLINEGGRGLYLVAELTQRWGTRFTRTGKVVWGEQSHFD